MNKLLPLALLALAGCATCRDHPAMCATVGAVVVASAVLCLQGASHHPDQPITWKAHMGAP